MRCFRISVLSAAVAGLAVASASIEAHRLDEYLQATRVAVDRDRVDLEIDLTPGVALAVQIFDAIDADGDGEISPDEGRAYANRVIGALTMEIDGGRVAPSLVADRFPTYQEMSQGVGTIRLRATAPLSTRIGRHRLRVRNDHRAGIGVYLVNALVPATPDVEIVNQARDPRQHELRLDYRVLPATRILRWAFAAGAIAMILVLVAWRWKPSAPRL